MSETPPSPTTRFVCSTCGKQYQRSSHLRRHESIHSENNKFRCNYCGKSFERRDVWRKHSVKCPSNSSHEVIPLSKRGRKPRACDACFLSRLACDADEPCGQCLSSQVDCTYNRLHAHGEAIDIVNADNTPLSRVPTSAVEEADTKIAVLFLLSLTDPMAESMIESLIEEPSHENEPTLSELHSDTESGSDLMMDSFSYDLMTDESFFPFTFSMNDLPEADMIGLGGYDGEVRDLPCQRSIEMEHSLTIIVDDLCTLHAALISSDNSYDGTFDLDLARRVFVPENREVFVSAYFRYTHPNFPLTHRPSFNAEAASLRLVLAIFICGSLYSAPRDCVLSTRGFFRIAEEYIFRHLDGLLGHTGGPAETKELYESLQAALLIHCTQYAMSSATTRRRNRMLRLPALVSAVRTLALTNARQVEIDETHPQWSQFIHEETRLRIAIWTLLADWHQSGMFHYPPLMTIYEMRCNLPCLPELWEAGSADEFGAIISARGSDCWQRSVSIRQAVEALMNDPWQGIDGFPLRPIILQDLHLLVFAIHCVVRTAKFMALLPSSGPTILRATTRWQDLWRAVTSELKTERLRKSGLVRHSSELCQLAAKLVKLSISCDDRLEKSPYYQSIGHDSLDELHTLIREF